MPSVSTVIPAYNRAGVIGRALDSVIAQTFPAKEIIVVDDGSTDGTGEFVAANYPQVKLVRQSNRGLPAARNAAIAQAKGEFIAFLDTDDVWLPDKLAAQIKVFTAQPDLGLLATQKYMNREDYPIYNVPNPRVRRFPFSTFLKRTKFHPSSVMIHKPTLDKVGYFDESLTSSEDWDLWARIAYRYPVARIKQPLVAIFEMEDSMSRSRRRKYLNDAVVLAKWNPSRLDTYDTGRRLTPLLYQRYVTSFTILRGARLLKYEGKESVREFLRLVEEKIGMTPITRLLVYSTLRLTGFH